MYSFTNSFFWSFSYISYISPPPSFALNSVIRCGNVYSFTNYFFWSFSYISPPPPPPPSFALNSVTRCNNVENATPDGHFNSSLPLLLSHSYKTRNLETKKNVKLSFWSLSFVFLSFCLVFLFV